MIHLVCRKKAEKNIHKINKEEKGKDGREKVCNKKFHKSQYSQLLCRETKQEADDKLVI